VSANGNVIVPKVFVWKRLHSLFGLMIVFYLVEHLTVNSQAALWLGDDGSGFIKLVNLIHNLPFLQVLEVVLIGVPILFHGVLGIKYAVTSRNNSIGLKKDRPVLSYGRNVAFSWQRITSWVLIIGIVGHVVQMRFLDSPKRAVLNNEKQYLVRLDFDEGLYSLSNRLNVELFDREKISSLNNGFKEVEEESKWTSASSISYSTEDEKKISKIQNLNQEKSFIEELNTYKLNHTQVVAVSENAGTAFLLMVRNTFKSPVWAILYTLFVIAAVFHGFNGLWTALITWGVILSYRSQKMMVNFVILLMLALGFLGLASIWGTYFINLRS